MEAKEFIKENEANTEIEKSQSDGDDMLWLFIMHLTEYFSMVDMEGISGRLQ